MRHVEAGTGEPRQFDGFGGAEIARFFASDGRVVGDVRVVAILRFVRLHVGRDGSVVLAMHHDGQAALLEDGGERIVAFHLHFARAAAHEELDAGHEVGHDVAQLVNVSARGTDEAPKVDVARLGGDAEFLHDCFARHARWQRVGHVENRGHTACGSGQAFGREVGLVRETRVAEVHVLVNHPRQEVAPRGIDHLVGGEFGHGIGTGEDFVYAVVVDEHAPHKGAPFIDNRGVLNLNSARHGRKNLKQNEGDATVRGNHCRIARGKCLDFAWTDLSRQCGPAQAHHAEERFAKDATAHLARAEAAIDEDDRHFLNLEA